MYQNKVSQTLHYQLVVMINRALMRTFIHHSKAQMENSQTFFNLIDQLVNAGLRRIRLTTGYASLHTQTFHTLTFIPGFSYPNFFISRLFIPKFFIPQIIHTHNFIPIFSYPGFFIPGIFHAQLFQTLSFLSYYNQELLLWYQCKYYGTFDQSNTCQFFAQMSTFWKKYLTTQ